MTCVCTVCPLSSSATGAGTATGSWAATHHALEDYGVMLSLPKMRAYVPAFDSDLRTMIENLMEVTHPAYLRLGLSEEPAGAVVPTYAPWRRLVGGRGWVVLVTGPLVGGIWDAVRQLDEDKRPALWLRTELPLGEIPNAFLDDLARSPRLLVVEEHVAQGGLASMIARGLMERGRAPERFVARSAQGYPSGRYGSQKYHRRECGLDPAAVVEFLTAENA